ncbi:MerR family transcriptional regulator [Microbacterium sp. AZCO]|uniref:MerR family transcriptional regulator n=1 Tax=Microbacterium sp. AZCO TaxID=3142976 RepID=UPI0031F45EEC
MIRARGSVDGSPTTVYVRARFPTSMDSFMRTPSAAVSFAANSTLNFHTVSRSSQPLRIGELSRRSGVSARSLRYYEERGLIGSTRAANGYRQYDESVVERASAIHLLFEMGFPRETVASVLTCIGDVPDATHRAVEEQLERVRDDLAAQMDKLAETHRLVTSFLDDRASLRMAS